MPIQQKLTPPVLPFSDFAGWLRAIFDGKNRENIEWKPDKNRESFVKKQQILSTPLSS